MLFENRDVAYPLDADNLYFARGQGPRSLGLTMTYRFDLPLCAIAVPVRNRAGRTVAALNVSLQYGADICSYALSTVLPALAEGARTIERSIEHLWSVSA